MPTDYDEIRAENIARYGWDTAVLDLLGHLYSDRTHFIFELIQNAEDAGATEMAFALSGDRLEVRHDGRPFTTADVRGICGVSQGAKASDLTQIGKFGIGFKSVYAYTSTPLIASGDECFSIRDFVRPYAAAPPPATAHAAAPARAAGQTTTFVFPFDRPEVPAALARDEIAAALNGLDAEILLFLRYIGRISVRGCEAGDVVLERTLAPGTPTADGQAGRRIVLTSRRNGRRTDEMWLIWSRPLDALGEPELRVEIAFGLREVIGAHHLTSREYCPLVVFFPTEKETGLGFLIQGPYRTTPARDNVPEHDAWNRSLVVQTAALLGHVLAELRDDGLLTTDIWQALPLEAARFRTDSMFRPLFDIVAETVRGGRFIPDHAGGCRPPAGLRLSQDSGVRDLLTPDQLGALCAAPGPVGFVAGSVTPQATPRLWHYLRDEIGVAELTPRDVVEAMTGEFLAAQPDDWIAGLYRFLYQHQSLWQSPAAGRPIIRLADGSQVLPFTGRGRPAAYLPGPAETGYPTVRRAIAGDAGARRFLTALGFAEPDVLAEVIDHVLPGYSGEDTATLNLARHEADIELVARALADSAPAARERLLEQVRQTAFLLGENAASGESRLMRPGELYQRSPGLETYFGGNPDAWFAADRYGPWRAQLRDMGVREIVRLDARAPDELGNVRIADEFARHERGLAGFDPGASLDGLGHALAHPDAARSEFVWNVLLRPNRQLISGVLESSPRLGFADARRQQAKSRIGELATAAAWLPAADGTFGRPADMDLDDLPATFIRDDGLAHALGMSEQVIEAASRQLGFPAGFLRRLSAHPDLVESIDSELRHRESGAAQPARPRAQPF